MKKRAFTLTELLVVVVIIGVLSAVVLPKFTKVLQTRKTTEAENVMAAVRNEQEARCMVGRNYVGQNEIGKLASLPKATSKNYTYTLDAQGITATAKDGNYTLQIPSYTDGRICCSGEGCEKLNKDYPACNDTFLAAIDQSPCEAPIPEEPEPEPEPEPDPTPQGCGEKPAQPADEPCGCNNTGHKSYTWNEESCEWELGSTCEGEDTSACTKSCDETAKPELTTKCKPEGQDSYCGIKTREAICDASTNFQWQAPEWTEVSCEPANCPKPCPETCPEEQQVRIPRVKTYSKDVSECCDNSCDFVCAGSEGKEYYEKYGVSNYGRPCRNINAQKQAEGDSSRVYNFWQGDRFYQNDPSSCYYCASSSSNQYPDLKDSHGNVLVKGWDADTCSNAVNCPSGYIRAGNTCLKVRRVEGTMGVPMTGHILTCGPQVATSGALLANFYAYEGGYKSVEGGGYVTVKGYTRELGMNIYSCNRFGGAQKMCESCDGGGCICVESYTAENGSQSPAPADNSYAQIITNYETCGGLSFQSSNHECCLGTVNKATYAICD